MFNGRAGPRSLAGALELFEKAAAKENSGAMFALGTLNSGGHNLPVDRRVAQRWLRAAAERGNGHAQLMLGRYLVKGVAGELNPVEGRLWLEPLRRALPRRSRYRIAASRRARHCADS